MNYISRSACKGKHPQQFSTLSYFERKTPLAYMMRNREAIRYVVAPFGFGKSLLACSYANLVNGFENTFWLDAANPCFLRDLDAHALLPNLMEASEVGDLIVLDDVPYLGTVRRNTLWKACSTLVQAGRELVICSSPAANPLRGHEEACVLIESGDLLYNESDQPHLHAQGMSFRRDVPVLHPVGKVPSLVACNPGSFCSFLRAHIDEMDNPAQSALSFVLLILERGTFEELEQILGAQVNAQDVDATRLRAFMQLDFFAGEFAALGFPLKEVLDAFMPYMSSIALELGLVDVSDLALRIANVLLERGSAERAAQVLLKLCDQQGRSAWLAQYQARLIDSCEFVAAEMLYESLRNERLREKPELYAASCIRRCVLNDDEDAIKTLGVLATREDLPLAIRLQAASFAYVHIDDIAEATRLEKLFAPPGSRLKKEAEGLEGAALWQWAFWSKAASAGKFDTLVNRLKSCDRADEKSLALACCLHKAHLEDVKEKELSCAHKQVLDVFEKHESYPSVLGLVMLKREADLLALSFEKASAAAVEALRHCDAFEDELEVQRTTYARRKALKMSTFAGFISTQHGRRQTLSRSRKQGATPLLQTRLFGRLEIRVGDALVDREELRRHKVRTLFAILVLECGHELSCDYLAERLWPDSNDKAARHNLYNCISLLRKALMLGDDTCPYLHRQHGIITLKQDMVKSDVASMQELLKTLRFSEPDPNLYYHMLEQIQELYRGELLPSEFEEPIVIAAREDWRNKVVNTLIHAARRLMEIGDSTGALQFTEQALMYNPQREDCYEQLMSLQARCGQRPAAVRTWIRYRTFLKDELGLDPSQRMSDLYKRIISENT